MSENDYDETAQYRTKAKAEAGSDTRIADADIHFLALPTLFEFENAISLYQSGKAYLCPVVSTQGLRFENGEMFFEGDALRSLSTAELRDMRTDKGIEKIDIPLLAVYYSIILREFYSSLKSGSPLNPVITIYAPELMRCIGQLNDGSGTHETDVKNIMRKTGTFQNIIGVLDVIANGKKRESYFPVLVFMGYDAARNTISFSSPYLNHIVKTIYSASLVRDKNGNPKKHRSGKQIMSPSHSYLIKSSIAKERNKAAVENVRIIVQLIEQAGSGGTPHIKASTVVERNEVLKSRLRSSSNQLQLLQRVFKKTWELLRDQTTLLGTYEGIELPAPDDISSIPTPGNLGKLVFRFPHKGKKTE